MEYTVVKIQDYKALLFHAATSFPDQCFLRTSQEMLTFSDFFDRVSRVANCLTAESANILVCKIVDPKLFAIGYFAAVLTGHIACLLPEKHEVPASLQEFPLIQDQQILSWMSADPIAFTALCPPLPDEPCTIAFSSGTSSTAKGVVLSQENLLTDTQAGMKRFHYWSGQRLVHILPYWHLFGLLTDLLAPLHAGVSVFLLDTPLQFYQALQTFRPHTLHIPPAVADMLCAALLSSQTVDSVTGGALEKIMCAGAALSEQTANTLLKFRILPCTAYGLTECSPCISLTQESDIRIGTVGPPLSCVKVKIADDGEILVSGPTVMLGYFSDTTATELRIQNGFLHTGDIGKLDEAGHLCILGRKSSMLVFPNGKKCIPESVETIVNKLPQITESLLSTCETENGIIAMLTVVTQISLSQVSQYTDPIMKKTGLFPYKLVIRQKPLSRNAIGKVLRK